MFDLLIPLALATAPLQTAPAEEAAPAPMQGASEAAAAGNEQLLLLAVELDHKTISESMAAYGDPSDPLLPVGELTRLLDLPFEVHPSVGLIAGTTGEGQRPVAVDLAAHQASVGGRVVTIAPDDVKVTQVEIFLRSSRLAQILPISFQTSAADLVLAIIAREKLPIQSRNEREARIRDLSTRQATEQPEAGLFVPTPYKMVAMPSFDLGFELGADSAMDRPVTRFEGRIAGDFAKTGVVGWVASNEAGKLSSARVTATRRSADNDLFGPLHASLATAGDVYAPGLTVGPRSVGGAGIAISSASLEQTSVFQHIDLRGELPIGYDIELYTNDVLRSGQEGAKTQGRYEFTNVPLMRGRNTIRIVLYGPHGERSEQTRIVNVGGGQLAAGQTSYDIGLVAQDRALLRLSQDDTMPGNLAQNSLRGVFSIAHGFTAKLTGTAGFASYEDSSGTRRDVLNAGVVTSLAGVSIQGDVGKDIRAGTAFSLGLAGTLARLNYVFRHAEYSGIFNDEANVDWDNSRQLLRYDSLSLDYGLRLGGQFALPVSARLDRAQFTDGSTAITARARTSGTFAGTLTSISADYSRRTSATEKSESLVANISSSRFVDYKWQLRAKADVRLLPTAKVEDIGITADRAINDRFSQRLGGSKSFTANDLTFQAGATAHFGFADATLQGDWSTQQKRWRVSLQINIGLAWDPFRRGYRMTPPGPANGGGASLLAFIDSNANGQFDSGEQPVQGVDVRGGAHRTTTDSNGRAFVTGLGESASASLSTDSTAADVPFVIAPPQVISFAPRAGTTVPILYPLVPASELVVRLDFRQPDGKLVGLSTVHLSLVPQSGKAISATTEFDGTAVFDAVPPGTYRVELDPAQAHQLGMSLSAPLSITVGPDGKTHRLKGEVMFARSAQ